MCGICCCLFVDNQSSRFSFQVISGSIFPHLERRGPDHSGRNELSVENENGTICLAFVSTVLHLRGRKTPQPLQDECGNILLWNGEIFGGLAVNESDNDTLVLLEYLSSHSPDVTPSQHILSTMAKVQGPWSFVYWQANEQKLWFGRDYFGRRSLLWHLPTDSNDVLAVTSVTERNSSATDELHFEEVPADGLYCVDLLNNTREENTRKPFAIRKFEWSSKDGDFQNSMFLSCPVLPFNKQMPSREDLRVIAETRQRICLKDEEKLEENFTSEINNISSKDKNAKVEKIAVESEFSYLDNSKSIAGLSKSEIQDACPNCEERYEFRALENCTSTVNSRFSSPNRAPTRNVELNASDSLPFLASRGLSKLNDAEKSRHSFEETIPREATPSEAGDCKSIPQACCDRGLVETLWNSTFEALRDKFVTVLGEAVRKRVFNLPRIKSNSVSLGLQEASSSLTAKEKSSLETKDKDARVGILFSGGIDSMMIAALADRSVPLDEAIDLINVAFEQKSRSSNAQTKSGKKRKEKQSAKAAANIETTNFSVPDRLTGVAGLEELRRINPARQWNLIEVDVTLEELQQMRSRHVSHLVSPLNTVLDDSIGCALWFAARGTGHLRSSHMNCGLEETLLVGKKEDIYTSQAKVLLVGMGADEQLGGYARHRTRFINEGWSGLIDEIEMEVKRISKRNLGRDDRCISDHGREARFPFLDEDVVSFLNSLPVWIKTDPALPRGTGEKVLLRQAARLLGLTSSSQLPKRAIQFGSRIAKMESNGEKGSETCSRLEF